MLRLELIEITDIIRKIQKNTVLLFLEKQQGKEILKKKRTDMIRAMQHMR